MEWIDVIDKLPEHLEPVLFLHSDEYGDEFLTGWHDELNDCWTCTIVGFLTCMIYDSWEDCHFEESKIKYWMPLPQLPKDIS